jgi:hypothetical protein
MQTNDKKPVRFTLKKESVRELGFEELASVVGGYNDLAATASCCAACNTDGTSTWCHTKTTCDRTKPVTEVEVAQGAQGAQ